MQDNIDLKFYKFLLKSQWWSKERITQYQNKQTKKLVKHIYNNVPYYQNLMKQEHLKVYHFHTVEDLSQFPFLTKELIRENIEDFLAENIPREELREIKTGGTTGIPLKLYRNKIREEPKRNAFIYYIWSRGGVKLDDRGLNMHARPFDGKDFKHGIFRNKNFLNFSCPPIPKKDDWDLLYKETINFQPKFINGYPSVINMFAQYILENKKAFPSSVQSLFYSSENIYKWQEENIYKAFKIKPIGLYGANERVSLAAGCEYSSYYHIIPEFGFVELIDENDNIITRPHQIGQIVATSFINYAMPLIRYKTGDLASYINQDCQCGRCHTLLSKIKGRTREFAISKNNEKILFGYSIYGKLWEKQNLFKQIQFIQNSPGMIEVNIIPNGKRAIIKEEILKTLEINTENLFKFKINLVDTIERTTSGKQQIFIQKLKILTDIHKIIYQESFLNKKF